VVILVPMPELIRLTSTPRTRDGSVRLVGLARRQWGVVTRAQLEELGLAPAAIARWIEDKRVHRVYPSVYAVGHLALGIRGMLAAALFYAAQKK
jgi:Transcriptional regulator, AbiEi antitoxin